ncbi:hypothetical protein AAFF_G00061650 [Aldrovandia affinis]|uniref:Uncharacterized protein n=1 Tax=Aldrovandia affinis TaxID=143900 RepID=A0AAD7S003_9TELE|nr:hypothetical protein AAFF_G00061650 [Aldrovandia affinis]
MASRRVTIHRLQKPVLGDSNNSKDGSKDNISGEAKKKTKPAARVVKSQYLQPVDKKPTLKTPANGSSGAQRPASSKPDSTRKLSMNTPPRRSLACQSVLDHMSLTFSGLEPSILGGSKLQSTMLDGHCVRPDFDLSAMKGE